MPKRTKKTKLNALLSTERAEKEIQKEIGIRKIGRDNHFSFNMTPRELYDVLSRSVIGQEDFLKNKGWYPFNANFGTSEEKACVLLINRLVEENFKQKYKEIYLLRNELHFKIYNFEDGTPFSPDFVLFMKNSKGEQLTYQIFIEPKGKHLEKTDEWKEKFLLKIKEQFSSKGLLKFIETSKYKIIGVPFYNQADENKFKEELLSVIE